MGLTNLRGDHIVAFPDGGGPPLLPGLVKECLHVVPALLLRFVLRGASAKQPPLLLPHLHSGSRLNWEAFFIILHPWRYLVFASGKA